MWEGEGEGGWDWRLEGLRHRALGNGRCPLEKLIRYFKAAKSRQVVQRAHVPTDGYHTLKQTPSRPETSLRNNVAVA